MARRPTIRSATAPFAAPALGLSFVAHAVVFAALIWQAGADGSLDTAAGRVKSTIDHEVAGGDPILMSPPDRVEYPAEPDTVADCMPEVESAAGLDVEAPVDDAEVADPPEPTIDWHVASTRIAAAPLDVSPAAKATTRPLSESPAGRPAASVVTDAPSPPGEPSPGAKDVFVQARKDPSECPPPHYPPAAERAGWRGTVVLEVAIDARGTPLEVTVFKSSGYTLLDGVALQAVRGWRFVPATLNGRPVGSQCHVPVRFGPKR